MSKEIKFRAWIKKGCESKLGEVTLINLDEKNINYIVCNKKKEIEIIGLAYFNEYELMQYTGLKDSEGYEIYEDDIVWNEYDEEYQVIILDEGEYKLMGESHIQNLFNNLDYIDVRGNIYENLELVKAWYKED
jgi:ORF029